MRTFRDYMASLPEERRRKIEEGTQKLIFAYQLEMARKARRVSQKQLAAALRVSQPAIAKMEHEEDMKLSTLKRLVEGMGGSLRVEAEFPDGVSHRLTV
ncbi:MAG: helix-turn-helix transcriptional regulator [Synergistaceae bacterium]|nr:helix-turn-helix transcriptional regulator [Candidatus Equadaptatus faecalis]